MNGIWAVEFTFGDRRGSGVIVVRNDRLGGGDSGFIYSGPLARTGDRFASRVFVQNHTPDVDSVFKPLQNFHLLLEGAIQGTTLHATGAMEDQPELTIAITGTLKAAF
jgi:hypothetical protein